MLLQRILMVYHQSIQALLILVYRLVQQIQMLGIPTPVICLAVLVLWVFFAFFFKWSMFDDWFGHFEAEKGLFPVHVAGTFFYLVAASKDTHLGAVFDNSVLGDMSFFNFYQWHWSAKVCLTLLIICVLAVAIYQLLIRRRPFALIRSLLTMSLSGMVGAGLQELYYLLAYEGILGTVGALLAIALAFLLVLFAAAVGPCFLIWLKPVGLLKEERQKKEEKARASRDKVTSGGTGDMPGVITDDLGRDWYFDGKYGDRARYKMADYAQKSDADLGDRMGDEVYISDHQVKGRTASTTLRTFHW